MFKWTDDKNKIKDVFDNIRNLVICGAISAGGIFLLKLPTNSSFDKWQHILSGVALVVGSLYLLAVNSKHAMLVIFEDIARKPSTKKRLFLALSFVTYILLSIQFVVSVTVRGVPQQQPATTKTPRVHTGQQTTVAPATPAGSERLLLSENIKQMRAIDLMKVKNDQK